MIKVAIPIIDNEEIEAAIEVLKSGYYTSGPKVEKFEKEFAKYIGTKYAVACNSGTAALHMVYSAIGMTEDSTFITSPMSFFATISAGMMCNSIPEFVDVDRNCNLDPSKIEESITENTSAIVPVHFYGHPCQIEKTIEIGKRYNIPVIEDCAQAHGAEYKGKRVGSFGLAGCFSFFATKNMTTIEGGMITTDNESLYEHCKLMRSHGMADRDTHSIIGYNYRMNELSGAIGIVQLKKLDGFNRRRTEISEALQKGIVNTNFRIFKEDEYYKHAYFWQPIFVKKPHFSSLFMDHLKKNKIGFRFRYNEPLYKQPIFRNVYSSMRLPNAELYSGCMFGLPNHPGMTDEEIQKVAEVVNEFDPK